MAFTNLQSVFTMTKCIQAFTDKFIRRVPKNFSNSVSQQNVLVRKIVLKQSLQTHFGSQCAIRKSKLIRVTNISHSSLISWTDGGGRAIAKPTMPKRGGCDFLFWLNEYWGRRRHNMSTTCNDSVNGEKVMVLWHKLWWKFRWKALQKKISTAHGTGNESLLKFKIQKFVKLLSNFWLISFDELSELFTPFLMTIIRYEKINWTMCEFDAKFIQILNKFFFSQI